MSSATITIRLDEHLKDQLEQLAAATHRSKSFLAAQAINEYVKIQEWQINEIKKGIAEADAGNLVAHDVVVKRWGRKRADSLDK
jgi:RHH-type rel operon transcriptional repressor/antitoxin RelB